MPDPERSQRGVRNPISFEDLAFDPALVLPSNIETTHKLLLVVCTELRRLRSDLADYFPIVEIDPAQHATQEEIS